MQQLTCQTSADLVRATHRVVIGGHVRPDGDCLGSMVALGLGLRAHGVDVSIVMPEAIPARYRFLAPYFATATPTTPPELIIVVDTSDPHRIALPAALQACGAPLLVIDHHAAGAHVADYLWCNATYGAAALMIYDLLNALECKLTMPIAEALYTGILTDTGCFTYPNADERIFALALELVQMGLDTARIARDIYQSVSLAATRLLGATLATLECHDQGRIAIMHISQAMLRETGATPADTEDLINFARAIDTVVVAALAIEQADGTVRLGLRSKDPQVNVGQLAWEMGGGGHVCAAGVTLHEPLPTLLARLPALLHAFLTRHVTPVPTQV